ncbi:MAG: phage tail protein [Clostridiales bacterium]|nr:phage tail protein [Clostridiales bacterium]
MIPCLYAASETAFTTNGIGKLSDAVSCQVTEKRNSSYELKMTYPTDGIHADSIQKGCLILAKPSVAASSQPFRIYKITTGQSGTKEIAARHVSYQLNDITASTVYGASCRSAILSLKTNATTPCDFTFSTDIDSDVPLSIDEPNSLRNCLGGIDGSILDTYGGEFEWNRFNVVLHKERGADNGVRIVYGKNLVELTLKEDDGDVITGVHPFWKGSVSVEDTDDSGDTTVDTQEVKVELPEKLVMVDGATEYRIRVLDCSTVFESQPTEEQLRAYAESYLASTSYTTPAVDVEINFAQLWQTPDYADIAAAEQVSLCDTVHVYLSKLGIEVSSKVTETVYDTLLERYESITLSNSTVVSSRSLVSTIDDLVSASVSALETKQTQEYSTLYASIQTLVAGSITAETVRAIIADFDYVAVDELDAAVADLGYVTAKQVEADYIKVENLSAAVGELGYLTAENAALTYATITTLNTNYLTAGEISARYAAIDFANVEVASVGTLFATVGLLSDMTIVDGYVTGALNGVTISANQLTAGTIDAGTITVVNLDCANLTVGTINGNQIAAGTITADNLAEDVTGAISNAQATADGKNTVYYSETAPSGGSYSVNDIWYDTDDGNAMYYWDGSEWVLAQYGSDAIAVGAVTAEQIAASAVTAAKIAAGTITSNEIASGTILASNIASGTITGSLVAADTITGDNIASETITADNIVAGAITTSKLAASAVTAEKIASAAITTDKLAANAVTAAKIDVTDLFAQDITATGTITGVTIKGATGDFSGTISATSGTIGGWSITTNALSNTATVGHLPYTCQMAVSTDDAYYHPFSIKDDTSDTYTFYISHLGYIKCASITATSITASQTLSVTGATTLNNTLSVTGAATLSSTLAVTGAATLSSSLSVSSTITVGNNARFANGYGVYVADTGGTYRLLGNLNAANNYLLCTGSMTNTLYIGTTSYTSNIYLRTAGSVYAGPKSIRVPEVQKGYISITPSAANTPTGSAVTFSSTFSGTPRVVATPSTTVPGTTVTGVGTSGASSTGVTIYVTRTNTSSTGIHWIAVY